jgi:hypothetical protein
MSTIRKILFAAIGCIVCVSPVSAAQNQAPRGAANAPKAADGTLGMALLSARVNVNATLAKGVGVTSVGKTPDGDGWYEVVFDRDVSGCAYAVTPATFFDRLYGAVPSAGKPNGVLVRFRDIAGVLRDTPFHLIVFCAN